VTVTPKPYFYLYMWSNGEMAMFVELEPDEWQIVKHRQEQYRIYDLNGGLARIFVATDDNNLDRQKALKTASSFVYGRYKIRRFDLDKLEVTDTDGFPLFHPPY